MDLVKRIERLKLVLEQLEKEEEGEGEEELLFDFSSSPSEEEGKEEGEEKEQGEEEGKEGEGLVSAHDEIIYKLNKILSLLNREVEKETEIRTKLNEILTLLGKQTSEQKEDEEEEGEGEEFDIEDILHIFDWTSQATEKEREDNPPSWVMDEDIWERAKKAVEPYWNRYRDPYAVVVYVYKQMGGRVKKKKKK